MIIKSGWFNSATQSGNGHYSVDHYSKAEWFYWRWNQRICWFRCWRNSIWAVLNPVVQYSGGDDSILYGTDGIRWFYSIVHVSSIPKWLEYWSDWYSRESGVWDDVRNVHSIDICCGKAIDSLMVMESVFVILWWVDDWYVVVVKWKDTLEQSVLLMSSLQVGCVCFNWIGSNQLKWFLSMNRGKGETVLSSDHGWYQWWNETAIIYISRRSYPTRFIHSRVVIGWSVIIIRIEHSLLDL